MQINSFKKAQDGSTLVECIAAVLLFSFSAMILLTGVLTAGGITDSAEAFREASDNAAASIGAKNAMSDSVLTQSDEITFEINFEGIVITSKGRLVTARSGEVRLTAVDVTKAQGGGAHIIPDTGVPVNGEWPTPESFVDQNGYQKWITINKGTTFYYDGVFYIVTGDISVGLGSGTPLPTNGWWYNNNGSGVAVISSRPVIVWSGGDSTQFYQATGGAISIGDKVLWNGDYYVFTIKNQSWANPPNISLTNWEKIVAP